MSCTAQYMAKGSPVAKVTPRSEERWNSFPTKCLRKKVIQNLPRLWLFLAVGKGQHKGMCTSTKTTDGKEKTRNTGCEALDMQKAKKGRKRSMSYIPD